MPDAHGTPDVPPNGDGRGVDGVLFDIDDTLVDLERAMGLTLQAIPDPALSHLTDDDWLRYKALYTTDPQRHYDRFLAGEVTFEEQRVHRVRHARAGFTSEPFLGFVAEAWVREYERTLPLHFQAYDDVVPLLDELDARGVPYGAVSNNVHAYQRVKLDRAGLKRIRLLVGIDTVGQAPGSVAEDASAVPRIARLADVLQFLPSVR